MRLSTAGYYFPAFSFILARLLKHVENHLNSHIKHLTAGPEIYVVFFFFSLFSKAPIIPLFIATQQRRT